ncbi:16532_t:CDS:2 [Funneliformis geosporum]|nr:16532_t:CDS:2 [Funneliformis geosporum]
MYLQPTHTPYPTKEWFQPRRYKDFPELFGQAIRILWNCAYHSPNIKCPCDVLEAKELVLDENNNLQEVERASGTNSLATELARSLGIPKAYLSANSGARIVLEEEIMNNFNVVWIDKGNPSKGIKYLYLDSETYKQLHQNGRKSVIAEEIVEEGETRHKITDIIGSKDGKSVECLKGSGLIAGITSRAYENGFTKTYLDVCYMPPKGPYNSRWLIAGKYEIERYPNIGRARLSGIVESIVPADPANADSHQQLMIEAGQV